MSRVDLFRRRGRVIDRLRDKIDGQWCYDVHDHVWIHASDKKVRAYARHAPKYDGDDDHFVVEYRWDDTGDVVL